MDMHGLGSPNDGPRRATYGGAAFALLSRIMGTYTEKEHKELRRHTWQGAEGVRAVTGERECIGRFGQDVNQVDCSRTSTAVGSAQIHGAVHHL